MDYKQDRFQTCFKDCATGWVVIGWIGGVQVVSGKEGKKERIQIVLNTEEA